MKKLIKRVLTTLGVKTIPHLDKKLAGVERVFKAPPFTPELVESIRLISPQFHLTTNEKSREFWEAEQNGACWGEYEALTPLFQSMPRPGKILDIGPGLGRSLVFFSKKLGWESSQLCAYEGEGRTTKYTILGSRFEDSFCGNIGQLRRVLEFNAINNVTIFNTKDTPMAKLSGPFDLIYSFYSIGFHWSLEHFLDDLLCLMDDKSVAVFMVPDEFKPFQALASISYRIIDGQNTWFNGRRLRMLVVGKKSIPNW